MKDSLNNIYVSIGNINIEGKIAEVEQATINFDYVSPRFYLVLQKDCLDLSQNEIFDYLTKEKDFFSLCDQISINGLNEPIIIRDGDNVVLDGNRRLAAYRYLVKNDCVKWSKIKCIILPQKLTDHEIISFFSSKNVAFNLQSSCDIYFLANYFYNRIEKYDSNYNLIAEEINFKKNDVKYMIDTIELMKKFNDNNKLSFKAYYEYLKLINIKKFREKNISFDEYIIPLLKNNISIENIKIIDKVLKFILENEKI